MKQVILTMLDIIADLEKKLKQKEDDLNKVINYLAMKGIYITVHSEELTSKLDAENVNFHENV